MDATSNSTPIVSTLVPDPGRRIRGLVALFLRLSIGLQFLNAGLSQYTGAGGGSPMGFGGMPGLPGGMDAFFTSIPYLYIAVALALILGFLTTVSAALAAGLNLLVPGIYALMFLAGISSGATRGVPAGRFGMLGVSEFFMATGGGSQILSIALLMWLSPVQSNIYSLDTIVFQRQAPIEEEDPAPERTEPMVISE